MFRNLPAAWLPGSGIAATKISWNLSIFRHLNTEGWKPGSVSFIRSFTNYVTLHEDNIFTTSTSLSHHAPHNLILNQPFAHTDSYFYSFVPQTLSYWNKLNPTLVTCPSLSAFKHHLPRYCTLSAYLLSSQGHVLTLALVAIHMHPLPTFWHKYCRKGKKKKKKNGEKPR